MERSRRGLFSYRIVRRNSSVALALGTGAALGWGLARLLSIVSLLSPDPAHYREYAALRRLSTVTSAPPWVWMAAGVAVCLVAWYGLMLVYRWQKRPMGWRASAALCLPVAAGAVLLQGDLLSEAGRSMAVAGVGMAGPGLVFVALLLVLSPVWKPGAWRPTTALVWACSVAAALMSGIWMALVQEPTGDEPSYLLAMHSLVYDGDLDVGDNHARQDYRHFYPTTISHGQLLPTMRGITLPKHSLGLAVLGALAYALGGRLGVAVLCALITAASACAVYHLLGRRGRDRALQCWSVVLLCAPLAPYAGQIYPNALTGLLVIVVLLHGARHPVASGVAAGMIPWLHLGTWPLAVGVALLGPRSMRGALKCLAGALPLWGALLAWHFHFWGAPLPPTGVYGSFSLATMPSAVPGLFLDQEAGLLWIAPVWFLMLAGIARRPRVLLQPEGLLFVGWILYVSTFNWWYGGWSPTGRFLLPALGMMALLLAEGLRGEGSRGYRLWLASGSVTVVLIAFPFFRFNARDGSHAVLDALGAPGSALGALLPTTVEARPWVWAWWTAALAALLFVAWHRDRQAA